jgi:hypothetical protein
MVTRAWLRLKLPSGTFGSINDVFDFIKLVVITAGDCELDRYTGDALRVLYAIEPSLKPIIDPDNPALATVPLFMCAQLPIGYLKDPCRITVNVASQSCDTHEILVMYSQSRHRSRPVGGIQAFVTRCIPLHVKGDTNSVRIDLPKVTKLRYLFVRVQGSVNSMTIKFEKDGTLFTNGPIDSLTLCKVIPQALLEHVHPPTEEEVYVFPFDMVLTPKGRCSLNTLATDKAWLEIDMLPGTTTMMYGIDVLCQVANVLSVKDGVARLQYDEDSKETAATDKKTWAQWWASVKS